MVKSASPPLNASLKTSLGATFLPSTYRKKLPQIAFSHKAAENPLVFSTIMLEVCLLCLNGNLWTVVF